MTATSSLEASAADIDKIIAEDNLPTGVKSAASSLFGSIFMKSLVNLSPFLAAVCSDVMWNADSLKNKQRKSVYADPREISTCKLLAIVATVALKNIPELDAVVVLANDDDLRTFMTLGMRYERLLGMTVYRTLYSTRVTLVNTARRVDALSSIDTLRGISPGILLVDGQCDKQMMDEVVTPLIPDERVCVLIAVAKESQAAADMCAKHAARTSVYD